MNLKGDWTWDSLDFAGCLVGVYQGRWVAGHSVGRAEQLLGRFAKAAEQVWELDGGVGHKWMFTYAQRETNK